MSIINVYGIGEKEINTTISIKIDGVEYEEAAITTDGALVAFDEASAMWVQLWHDAESADYTIID